MKAELEKIKDSVAIKIGFQNWKHYGQNATITDKAIDRVAELYARIQIEKDREDAELILNADDKVMRAVIAIIKARPINLD